jgi:hypothetical protein
VLRPQVVSHRLLVKLLAADFAPFARILALLLVGVGGAVVLGVLPQALVRKPLAAEFALPVRKSPHAPPAASFTLRRKKLWGFVRAVTWSSQAWTPGPAGRLWLHFGGDAWAWEEDDATLQ